MTTYENRQLRLRVLRLIAAVVEEAKHDYEQAYDILLSGETESDVLPDEKPEKTINECERFFADFYGSDAAKELCIELRCRSARRLLEKTPRLVRRHGRIYYSAKLS